MAGAFRKALPGIECAEACGRKAAALQAPQTHGRSAEALSGRAAHAGEHWSSKEISGRISEERPGPGPRRERR